MIVFIVMRKIVAEKLATQVAEWGHKGVINADEQRVLLDRYSVDWTLGRILLRWLGFIAIILLASSVLGLIGMAIGEAALYITPPLLGVIACLLWVKGTAMAVDPTQRYATSGAVLVTLSFFVGFAALSILLEVFDIEHNRITIPFLMLLTSAAAFFTAYRYGLRWPLLIGILISFHALGHMHRYGGSGSYFMGIADERITFIVALVALYIGMRHERELERNENRLAGFGHVFIVVGLLYANLSLWFLSTPRGSLALVLAFAAAGIAQLIAGGRFHDGRFTGFGIVFLSINLYTRMFEGFWNEISKGSFFFVAGCAALLAGVAFEHRARKLQRKASE